MRRIRRSRGNALIFPANFTNDETAGFDLLVLILQEFAYVLRNSGNGHDMKRRHFPTEQGDGAWLFCWIGLFFDIADALLLRVLFRDESCNFFHTLRIELILFGEDDQRE